MRKRLHGHLGLQLPELLFLVVLDWGLLLGCRDSISHVLQTRVFWYLTLWCIRHPVDFICNGHCSRLEHLLIQLLLLHVLELSFQLFVVDRISDLVSGDGVDNFFAEVVLYSDFLPELQLVGRPSGK